MGILDYFTPEARRGNRQALEGLLMQFIPPEMRPQLNLLAELNPVVSMERAGQDAQQLFAPDQTLMDRLAAGGRMASNMAGVVAPAMVAGRAGVPVANAVQDVLTGYSPMVQPFMADEFGGFRLYQGSPHNFSAERLVRMPDGSTQYVVGAPDRLPDVPAGAEVLQDFPLGRQRMDKIGTGEGAQAYGHGLYGAEAEDVARGYQQRLADISAGEFDAIGIPPRQWNAATMFARQADPTQPEAAARDFAQWTGSEFTPELVEAYRKTLAQRGKMYEMQINADPEKFLDWDRPFASADDLERFAAQFDAVDPELRRRIEDFGYVRQQQGGPMPDGNDLIREIFGGVGGKEAVRATEMMREAGIPGIRFLDAGSRGNVDVNELRGTVSMWKSAVNKTPNDDYAWKMLEESEAALKQAESGGTRNYVIFDENLINIVRKYGIAGAAAMLGMSQADVAQAMGQQPQGLLESGPQ